MTAHGVDITSASIRAGFDEALLEDGVGLLQKIFVFLGGPLSSLKTFFSSFMT